MANWKLTDVDEIGYEYECPYCRRHIVIRFKGCNLPKECPYCGMVCKKMDTEEKINELIEIIEFLVEVDTGISKQYGDWIKEKLHELKE